MPKYRLKEYRTKAENNPITDKTILGYIDECIDKMEELGYDIPKEKLKKFQTDATNTFGSMGYDFSNDGHDYWGKPYYGYILKLSKHMFNEPEKAIKNTIYHELCHLVAMEDDINRGYIYYDEYDRSWKRKRGTQLAGHGPRWQTIADKVSKAIGDTIQRTDDYIKHTGVGDKAQERTKWTFVCPSCGTTMNYQRKTKFVKEYNQVNPATGDPRWWCARCHQNLGKKVAFKLVGEENENN